MRLSAQDPRWGIIAQGVGATGGGSNENNPIDIEFSKDMNHLFVTTGGNQVHRIDGLGNLYSTRPTFETDAFFKAGNSPAATSMTSFSGGSGSIEGIGVNPSNADDIVLFKGSGGISRSENNATSASPSFSTLPSIGASLSVSPNTFDGIIDRNDPNVIVVGTTHGAFVTEDNGSSWTDASTGFTGTPVFEVRQSWRTWDEGNFKPGTVYLATYGRGIWSSETYLGTNDNDPQSGVNLDDFKTRLISYPNPATANTTVQFELAVGSDVTVNVYNLSGRLVHSAERKNMSEGTNEISIDVSSLATGTYIIKLNGGQQTASTKLIKQ